MADGYYIYKRNMGRNAGMTLLTYQLKCHSNIATHYNILFRKTRYFIPICLQQSIYLHNFNSIMRIHTIH